MGMGMWRGGWRLGGGGDLGWVGVEGRGVDWTRYTRVDLG